MSEPLFRTDNGRVQIQVSGNWINVVDLIRTLYDLADDGVIDCREPLDEELLRLNREFAG